MSLEVKPIGIVHSPFKQAAGTLIQASLAEGTTGNRAKQSQLAGGRDTPAIQ